MSHVPAPLTVGFKKPGSTVFAYPRVDGRSVGSSFYVDPRRGDFSREMQWARAFLDGCAKAPMVAGVRV